MGQAEYNEQQMDHRTSSPKYLLKNGSDRFPGWTSKAGQQPRPHYLRRRVTTLVLSIVLCSAIDAFWTLLHLERGFHEANPFMAQTLVYGPTFFMVLKMTLTGVGVLILAGHQRSPLAWQGLHAMGFVYALLLGYHLVLFGIAP